MCTLQLAFLQYLELACVVLAKMAISRAVTGIGLAMVLPAIQSLVADAANPEKRGLAFGWLQFTGNMGAMLGTVFSVSLAGTTVFGLAGWRASFHIIAAGSVVVAFLVYLLVVDPRFKEDPRGGNTYNSTSSALAETLVGAKIVMKIPTFIAIVAQGGLFGGWAGDILARHLPNTGRIILAQFSSGFGVLASAVLFLFLPQDSSTSFLHGALFFAMGFFMPWCLTAANSPIFAEIVPENLRTSIYALDQTFESFFASFATLLVALLAEHVFGYVSPSDDASTVADPQNAAALGKALSMTFGIPSACCCLLYSVLYWTYPKDRDKAKLIAELHHSNEDLNPYVSLSKEPDGDGAHIEKARDT